MSEEIRENNQPKFPYQCDQLFSRSQPKTSRRRKLVYTPRIYFEARIDLHDTRSNFKATHEVEHVLPPLLDVEALWTRDMLEEVSRDDLTDKPSHAGIFRYPARIMEADYLDLIESSYIRFLLKNYEVRIMRNNPLSLFSRPSETYDEFLHRCIDSLRPSFRAELQSLRRLFEVRLNGVKRKMSARFSGSWEKYENNFRAKLHVIGGKISNLFIDAELEVTSEPFDLSLDLPAQDDLDQDLLELAKSVHKELNNIREGFIRRAQDIDVHIIHPTLTEIQLIRIAILWAPSPESHPELRRGVTI